MKNRNIDKNSRKTNLAGIAIGTIISWIIGMQTDLHPSSGHAGFIPLVFPPLVGIFTILIYLISRIFIRKFNWVISLTGITYLLYFSIDFYIKNDI